MAKEANIFKSKNTLNEFIANKLVELDKNSKSDKEFRKECKMLVSHLDYWKHFKSRNRQSSQ